MTKIKITEDLKAREDTSFRMLRRKNNTSSAKFSQNVRIRELLEHPADSAAPVRVDSYQHQRRLHREVLLTVKVRPGVLVQVGQTPSGLEAFVRTTHLTHGSVSHGARFASLSHQIVKDL